MLQKKELPKHLYSLDIVRGLAALVVVLWHWQHLLYVDGIPSAYRMEDQPFYNSFAIFYNFGWIAVDFFFSLSGFVFFWLYADAIANKRIGGFSFFVVRFSRLYPLHFATFAFVAVAQFFLHANTGNYFVYQQNDVYRGVLNLFLANSWGLLPGASFNGPIWSVSVEVLLYFVFFVMCLSFSKRYMLGAVVCAVTGLVVGVVLPEVGRGLFSFFVGGLTFWLFSRAVLLKRAKAFTTMLTIFVLILWGLVLIEYEYSYFGTCLKDLFTMIIPEPYQARVPGLAYRVLNLSVVGLVFPCSILALALIEVRCGGIGKRFSMIGNLSYSSYLLHFPLIMIFYVTANSFGIDQEFFYSENSLLLFFVVLIPLCMISYNYFELPMQRFFRSRLSVNKHVPPKSVVTGQLDGAV